MTHGQGERGGQRQSDSVRLPAQEGFIVPKSEPEPIEEPQPAQQWPFDKQDVMIIALCIVGAVASVILGAVTFAVALGLAEMVYHALAGV